MASGSTQKQYAAGMTACPACGKNDRIIVELAIYDSLGRAIRKAEDRTDWIVRCDRCGTITGNAATREEAVRKWEEWDLTPTSWSVAQDGYTSGTEPFKELANAIVMCAVEDLKEEAIFQIKQKEKEKPPEEGHSKDKLPGEDWFLSDDCRLLSHGMDGDAIIKAVKEQAPYDIWRKQHRCKFCSNNRKKGAVKGCMHWQAYPWRAFRDGKATDCPLLREEEPAPRTADELHELVEKGMI